MKKISSTAKQNRPIQKAQSAKNIHNPQKKSRMKTSRTSPSSAPPPPPHTKTPSIEDRIKKLLDKGHLTAEEIFFLEVQYTAAYFNNKELFSKNQRDKIHKKIISTKEELEKINALCGPNGLLPALTRMISQGVYYFDQAQGHLKTLMILQDEARIKKILGSLLSNLLQNPDRFLSNLTANFRDGGASGSMEGMGAFGSMEDGVIGGSGVMEGSGAMGAMGATVAGNSAAANPSAANSATTAGNPPHSPTAAANFLEDWLAKQKNQGGKNSGKEKWTKEKIIERLLSQINFPMVEMIEDQKTKEVPNALLQRIQTLLRLGFSNAKLCLIVAEKIGKPELTAEIDEAKNMFGNIMIFFHRMLSKDDLEKWAKKSGTPLNDFFNPLFPFQMVNQKMPSSWPTKAKQQKARHYADQCTLVELDIKKLSKILGAS